MDNRQLDIDRMFPQSDMNPLLTSDEMKEMINAMLGKIIRKKGLLNFKEKKSDGMPAGYTYLFQFIAHDIVPDTTNNMDSRVVSPQLNLDSIYGQGEHNFDPKLFDGNGRFEHGINSKAFDVWRKPTECKSSYFANIPEQRNGENLIIVQLHRLFQMLHDVLVDEILDKGEVTEKLDVILEARKYTLAIFHTIIIDDALKKLLHPSVHEYLFVEFHDFYYDENASFTQIPYEFSHAAFRFGHSMVRSTYKLNEDRPNRNRVCLQKIIRRGDSDPLLDEDRVSWERFFSEGSGLEKADFIDLEITKAMGAIPIRVNIVEKNLLAGTNVNLLSAEKIISKIRKSKKRFSKFRECFAEEIESKSSRVSHCISPYIEICDILKNTANQSRTPLWLYALYENQTSMGSGDSSQLGIIGSAIVGDVIRESITANYIELDKNRHLSAKEGRKSLLQNAISVLKGNELGTMEDLFKFLEKRKKLNE